MDALREVATVKADYESALAQWQALVENLKMLEKESRYMPKGESTGSGRELIYQIADLKLFCRFTCLNSHGVLQFGYVEFGRPGGTEVVTGVLYFDQYGNIYEKPDETHASFTMRQPADIDRFYLPKLYEAVEKAMVKRQETIAESTVIRGTE